MKRYLLVLLLLSFFFTGNRSYGQLYNFTNYGLEQGLPQSTVFSTCLDSRGYLWVGTESGVARFNGGQFQVFDKSSGLPGNITRTIVEGTDGNIWVGTDKGIGVFNGKVWKTITAKDGLKGSAVTKLVKDKDGKMWVATSDSGINIITLRADSTLIDYINERNGLAANFVLDILHSSDGSTWVAMIGGASIITFVDGKPKIQNLESIASIPSNLFSCIAEDKKGDIWLGTLDAGAFLLSKKNNRFSVTPYGEQKGIVDSRIWDIYCDVDNQVWFGTNDNGLYHLKNNTVINISTRNGLPGNLVLSINRDKNRNLWIGSMNGLSLFQGFHLVHFTLDDGLPGKQVLALKANADNSLWVGGDGKGLAKVSVQNNKMTSQFFGPNTGFISTQVTSVDVDNFGNLILGTHGDGIAIKQTGKFKYLSSYDGLADDNINCVYWNNFGSIYAGTDVGYNEIKSDKIYTINEANGLIHPEVQTVISDLKGNIWMGTLGGLASFHPITWNYRDFNEAEGLTDLRIHALAVDKLNQIYIGTTSGIFRYNAKADTIVPLLSSELNAKTINSLIFYNDTVLIAGTTLGFNKVFFDKDFGNPIKVVSYDKSNGFKFSETKLNAICKDNGNNIWFGTVSGLTRYQSELEDTIRETPVVHITEIRLSFENVDWTSKDQLLSNWYNIPEKLKLKYFQNHITFDFDGIYLLNPEKVKFRYKLEPFEKNWSPASNSKSVTYPGLNDGKYTFYISASSDGVNWSAPITYKLTVSPPFRKTLWFYIVCVIGFIVVLIFFIRYRERKLRKEKEYLEQVVKERTAEVVAQKEHIEEQKEEITASITYARRIQQAVLPNFEILSENTSDCFILYKPRDIVSGDFYWIGKSDNYLVVAAADCTGHGVPGAFMSMLGISFMNKIVNELKVNLPEQILNHMRANVITSLKQGNYEGTTKDGMDMALCIINLDTLELTFSGAYNPAIIVENNEAVELKADRMPVGLHIKMDDFTHEKYQLKKGDCVYLFSDGFQDQMGGPDGRKFMRKNLRDLLVAISSKPFAEQKEVLESTIENWQNSYPVNGGAEQIDDILVLGFTV
ncbi:MAG TPA: two-component regulator propeller domain-containing protein [Tenuifilaceae bacterium]|nr:two-component regulator propeller domain-containing protein [Tenuifilaceae bacterium]HPN21311.1 two-component regulator propeller domain-containing protein [Tenuifilaceae bacterium]